LNSAFFHANLDVGFRVSGSFFPESETWNEFFLLAGLKRRNIYVYDRPHSSGFGMGTALLARDIHLPGYYNVRPLAPNETKKVISLR
jgi:hypothetical protein